MKSLLLLTLCATAWAQTGFDESHPDRLRLFTDNYEFILGKTTAAMLALTDKAAHADLTLGSRNDCLWDATFASPQLITRFTRLNINFM